MNPIAVISQHPGYCGIFHTWGFIEGSLCSGEHGQKELFYFQPEAVTLSDFFLFQIREMKTTSSYVCHDTP